MTRSQTLKIPGGTFFFSARLCDPTSDLLIREVGHLRAATRATKTRFPFRIDAAVILPAEVHMIWTLPAGDDDYSTRWAMLKGTFSKGLPAAAGRTAEEIKRAGKGIWEPRFTERAIRNPAEFGLYLNFVHTAPVAAGLAETPEDWLHSSIHRHRDPYHVPEALTFDRDPPAQAVLHGLILPPARAKVQTPRTARSA